METIIIRAGRRISAQIKSNILMVVLVNIFFAWSGSFAQAHPYLPMENGAKTLLAYRFHVKNVKMTPKPQEVNGEITMRYDRFEEKRGKR